MSTTDPTRHMPRSRHTARTVVVALSTAVVVALATMLAVPALGDDGRPDPPVEPVEPVERHDRTDGHDQPQGCDLLPDPTWCEQDPAEWPLPPETTDEERAVLSCAVDPEWCRDDVVMPDLPDTADPAAAVVACITDIPGCTVADGEVTTCAALTPECLGEEAYRDVLCAEDPAQCPPETGNGTGPETGGPETGGPGTSGPGVTVPPPPPPARACYDGQGRSTLGDLRLSSINGTTSTLAELAIGPGEADVEEVTIDWGDGTVESLGATTEVRDLHTYPIDAAVPYTVVVRVHDADGQCGVERMTYHVVPLFRATFVIDRIYPQRCDTFGKTEIRLGWTVMDRGRESSSYDRWSLSAFSRAGIAVGRSFTFDRVQLGQLRDVGVKLTFDDDDGGLSDFLQTISAPFDPRNFDFEAGVELGPAGPYGPWQPGMNERHHTWTLKDGNCSMAVDVTYRTQIWHYGLG